jgi:hypothetical protein
MAQTRFGVKQFAIDGVVYLCKSGVQYSLGVDKQESVMGVDRRHGVKITRIPAYIEAALSDGGQGFDLRKLTSITDAEVTVSLENGKTIKLGHANYAEEGKVTAEEGEIATKFEADPDNAEEI